jgi:hypothetical protein
MPSSVCRLVRFEKRLTLGCRIIWDRKAADQLNARRVLVVSSTPKSRSFLMCRLRSFFALSICMAFCSNSIATDYTWQNPNGGNWNVSTNWGGTPGAMDNVTLGVFASPYVVQVTDTENINNVTINSSMATLTVSGSLTVNGTLAVNAGVFNLTGGTLTLNGSMTTATGASVNWTGGTLTGGGTLSGTVTASGGGHVYRRDHAPERRHVGQDWWHYLR